MISHTHGSSVVSVKDLNQSEWSVENNTKDDELTDAYGEVKFKNFSEYSEVTAKVITNPKYYNYLVN